MLVPEVISGHELDRPPDDARGPVGADRKLIRDSESQTKRRNGVSVKSEQGVANAWSGESRVICESVGEIEIETVPVNPAARGQTIKVVVRRLVHLRVLFLPRGGRVRRSCLLRSQGPHKGCNRRDLCFRKLPTPGGHGRPLFPLAYGLDRSRVGKSCLNPGACKIGCPGPGGAPSVSSVPSRAFVGEDFGSQLGVPCGGLRRY